MDVYELKIIFYYALHITQSDLKRVCPGDKHVEDLISVEYFLVRHRDLSKATELNTSSRTGS